MTQWDAAVSNSSLYLKGSYDIISVEYSFMFFGRIEEKHSKIWFLSVLSSSLSVSNNISFSAQSWPLSMQCLSVLCCLLVLTWVYIELKVLCESKELLL